MIQMEKIINTAIDKRWLLAVLFLLLAVFGYYSWKQLSIEAYPDIADVTSQVVTQVPASRPKKWNNRSPFPWSVHLMVCRRCT